MDVRVGVRARKLPHPEVLGSGGGAQPVLRDPSKSPLELMGVGPGVIGLRALGAHEPCGALRAHEPRDLLTPRLAFVPSTSNLLYVVSSANVTRNFFADRAPHARLFVSVVPSLEDACCHKIL